MNQGQKRSLYLIMTDENYEYCLYRVGKPQVSPYEDETNIRELGKPLLEMDGSMFPELMGFAAVGSRIFMVGGEPDKSNEDDSDDSDDEDDETFADSRNVFIYDTKLSTLVSGPKLNSGKANPHLISLGSKIYVLSDSIYSHYDDDDSLDAEPRFEVLDTDELERGWSSLPIPDFHTLPTTEDDVFMVDALAAVFCGGGGGACSGGIILLSSEDAGTFIFDVDKEVWNHVSEEVLPFKGIATPLPDDPSMCCAFSLDSHRFSGFRFFYGGDASNYGFKVLEIEIDDAQSHSTPLPPEICYRPRITVLGPDGLVYFVDSGVDDAESIHTLQGNRYVKVSAFQLSNLNRGMKKRHVGHIKDKNETNSNKGQWLVSSRNTKREIRHDEEHDRTVEVGLKKAKSAKRGKRKRQKGHVQEEEERTNELILKRIWRSSFFGGPVCDPLLHVAAAFAM